MESLLPKASSTRGSETMHVSFHVGTGYRTSSQFDRQCGSEPFLLQHVLTLHLQITGAYVDDTMHGSPWYTAAI